MAVHEASATRASINSAIAAASNGDTINIAAGTVANGTIMSVTKYLTIQGQGKTSTFIVGPGFSINLSTDGPMEIKDIDFTANSVGVGDGINIGNGTVHACEINIHDCNFDNYEFGIWIEGAHGVVWNCDFAGNDHDFRNKGYTGSDLNTHDSGEGKPSAPWAADSLHQMVFEDCTFTSNQAEIRCDSEYPATLVIRHCSISLGAGGGFPSFHDQHGDAGEASTQQGVRIYNNTITGTSNDGRFSDIRGGNTNWVYNNTNNAGSGIDLSIDFSENPTGGTVATNNNVWNNGGTGTWSVNVSDGASYTASQPGGFVELEYPHPFRDTGNPIDDLKFMVRA